MGFTWNQNDPGVQFTGIYIPKAFEKKKEIKGEKMKFLGGLQQGQLESR